MKLTVDVNWNEQKHPRGNTANAGQFSSTPHPAAPKVNPSQRLPTSPKPASPAGAVAQRFKQAAQNFTEHDTHLIQQNMHKPHSQARQHWGHTLHAMAKAAPAVLKAHLREEKDHAVHAIGALRALGRGQKPAPHQWKGLRSLGTRLLLTAGSAAMGDVTGHLGHLAGHMANEVVNHVIGEHTAKLAASTVRAHYNRGAATSMGMGGDAAFELYRPEDHALLRAFIQLLANRIVDLDIEGLNDHR